MTFEELVRDHSAEMIEKLATWILNETSVDIRFDCLDEDQWSIVTMYQYEEDKELSLRLHLKDRYDLYFGYYDDEDEFFEIIHELTKEEKDIIPEVLKKLMKRVLDDEKDIRINGTAIKGKK